MPEERETTDAGVLSRIVRLEEKVETRFNTLEKDVATLKGSFDQMDKRFSGVEQRMGNIEQLQRWMLGIVITSWLTIMLAILLKGG